MGASSSTKALRSFCALVAVARASGRLFNAGTNGCGITGVQYVVREGEDNLSGALVAMTCGTSGCTDEEKYSTGVNWDHVYYFLQTGLPEGLHLVTSCENSLYQPVQVGSNAADATWYGVAVIGW